MKTKACSRCRTKKPVGEFYKNKAQPGGLSYWCKECTLAYSQSDHGREVRRRYTQSDRARANRQDHYYLNREVIIAANDRACCLIGVSTWRTQAEVVSQSRDCVGQEGTKRFCPGGTL